MITIKKDKILCKLFLLLFLSLFCQMSGFAQDNDQITIGPGMELLKVGDAKFLVPKGTKIRKYGDIIVIEDVGEYSGRKFEEIQARLDTLELQVQEIDRELKQLFFQAQRTASQKMISQPSAKSEAVAAQKSAP